MGEREETERPPLPCSLLFISFPSCHSCDKVATWDYWEKDKLQPRSQPASTVCAPDTSPSATVPKPGSLSRREKKLSVFYERRAIWYFLQKVLPWYKFLNQSGQALTCPCTMTSSDITQSQGTERWNSARRFHSAHDVSCDYPETYWYSSRAGTADDTRRQPTNVTGSGVCNWSWSVRHMPLVS